MACAGTVLLLSGCKSAFVEATVRNSSSQNLTLVEVDYPSASFGWQALPPGSERHYRFKILGNGPTTLTFSDVSGREHRVSGPVLREGESGSLLITLSQQTADWNPDLKRR